MNVTIVGTGYVGLVTGVCFADSGVNVTCVDRDADRIAALARGRCPIHEPRLPGMLAKSLREGRLAFTADPVPAIRRSLVVIIAVGTPSTADGAADLVDIEDAARAVATSLDGYKVIVTKSTVPVGTGRRIQRLIGDGLDPGAAKAFDVASNPEFLREGAAVDDFLRPSRVIIGADSPRAIAILQDLYRPLYGDGTPFVVTSLEAAELIKYACNGFLALKISFMNEMANLSEALGVDVTTVAHGMGLDPRIGPGCLRPGPGFGGSCLPKDLRALARLARQHASPLWLVEAAVAVNERQKARMVDKIVSALGAPVNPGSLDGLTIGVLGLAFKANTDDVRESPALAVVAELARRRARVQAYDPAATAGARAVLPALDYRRDPYDAAAGADALVLLTEWSDFRHLDLARLKAGMRRAILLDLRNVYEPGRARAAGFVYYGVGRS